MNNSQEIAHLIRMHTSLQKISLSQMFTNIGLGKNTLSNLDNGSMLKADSLGKIADYLGVSVDYLLGRTEAPQTIKNSKTSQHIDRNINITDNSETMELIEMIKNLSLVERAKVILFIDELKNKQQALIKPVTQSNPPIQPQAVQPPVQSIPQRQLQQPASQPYPYPQRQIPIQNPPQQSVSTEQPPQSEIKMDPKNPWRFTARRTDGRYESRLATPEEVEKLKLLENDPEPEF